MLNGVVLKVNQSYALALHAHPESEIVVQGNITLRYGVRFLGKPHQSIVPGLMVIEYGDMLTGEEAWEFLVNRSNRFPRAEVMGYRNDGYDDMAYVKALDLALPIDVLAYSSATETMPVASLLALIAPENTVLPARIAQYLPRFDTISAWREGDV